MRPFSPARSYPLQFLIYLEWGLLLVVALGEIPPFLVYQLPRHPWVNGVGLVLFTLLGVRSSRWIVQPTIVTALEISLIALMSFVGNLRLFAVLCIIFIVRCCFRFTPRVCWMLTAGTFCLCLLIQVHRLQYLTLPNLARNPDWLRLIWLSTSLLVGLVLVFLQLLLMAAIAEAKSREQLAIAHAKLRQYALEVETLATVQERNRIAREIHDSLGHSLTAFNLHLEAALRMLRSHPKEAEKLLLEAKQLGKTALNDVRQSVAALRSDPLEGQSLAEAIAGLATDCQRMIGVRPMCTIQVDRPLPASLKTATYRIVQEALTNLCKYSAATQVTITVVLTHQLMVLVADNGKGFDPRQNTTGFGLQGMRERTQALGGTFELTAALGRGCQILATFPLETVLLEEVPSA